MAACSSLLEGKLVFLAIYAVVVVGIVFSGLVILSALYTSSPAAGSGAGGNGKPLSSIEAWFFSSSSPPSTSLHRRPTPAVSRTPMSQTESPNMLTRAIWDVPADTRMPDLESFQLTNDMVKHRAKDNIVIVTFGNYAFEEFILNWVKHLTDINVFNLLVGAMDTKLLEALFWKGVPVFDMGSKMATIDVGWGSPTFHKMGREKVLLINALLPFGFELLMCDTDMVWLKNPLPYFARVPDADILTSSDQITPTVTDDSLEDWKQVTGPFNVGIFHWRPTEPAKKLAKEWKDLLINDEKLWDQAGFNELVRKELGPSVEGESGLVYAFDGTLKLGILPASIFCSGHTYFVQAMHHQLRLEPYAVHTTFQYAGTEGKRHRLREAMLFYDQPEYYDSPGGFLSFNPAIPKSLLLDGPHTLQSHFSLTNYQLKQIRIALAVASLLNRTLVILEATDKYMDVFWNCSNGTFRSHNGASMVMPPLWCRFERVWWGHPGILEGTLTRQPFLCPMDHVFEVNVMLSDLSEAEFGPNINFREFSFLQNPLVPRHVKESVVNVQLCDTHTKGCDIYNETISHGFIQFPRNSTEQKYLEVFSQYKDFKVLRFSSMVDAFQGFSDSAREAKFRNRVKRYVGLWCCVEHHDPGHIYYDMYWDEKPGWTPEPPRSREEDHPPWQ